MNTEVTKENIEKLKQGKKGILNLCREQGSKFRKMLAVKKQILLNQNLKLVQVSVMSDFRFKPLRQKNKKKLGITMKKNGLETEIMTKSQNGLTSLIILRNMKLTKDLHLMELI